MSRRDLARALGGLSTFSNPDPDLEQYPTPPGLAAHLVHLADLRGDLGRTVVDLGTGTGVLAVGAALRGARVVGVDLDPGPLATARENARRAGVTDRIDWVRSRVPDVGVCPVEATVLTNPPFGAQRASAGDRPFLETAGRIARVSYSVHNENSREFVEAFAGDQGGTVTDAFGADLELDRAFEFHAEDRRVIPVEVFRIEWETGRPVR